MAGSSLPGPLCGASDGVVSLRDGTCALAWSPMPGPVKTFQGVAIPAAEPDTEGAELVLTPLQLAAVLENESITADPSNATRLWGAATVLGGALELIGSGALLLTPEPTMVTKVAGGALGAHGLDTTAAGIRQVVSGQSQKTLTATATQSAAELLGADPSTAEKAGLVVDIAIPLLAGFVGAARVLTVRRGVLSLAAEEAAGGHTIARHVGRTEGQLRARLAAQPRLTGASTFHTLAEAERVVSEAIRANKAAIQAWAKSAPVGGRPQAFTHDLGHAIGFGVRRGATGIQQTTRVLIAMSRVQQGGRMYFVLTAYPLL